MSTRSCKEKASLPTLLRSRICSISSRASSRNATSVPLALGILRARRERDFAARGHSRRCCFGTWLEDQQRRQRFARNLVGNGSEYKAVQSAAATGRNGDQIRPGASRVVQNRRGNVVAENYVLAHCDSFLGEIARSPQEMGVGGGDVLVPPWQAGLHYLLLGIRLRSQHLQQAHRRVQAQRKAGHFRQNLLRER